MDKTLEFLIKLHDLFKEYDIELESYYEQEDEMTIDIDMKIPLEEGGPWGNALSIEGHTIDSTDIAKAIDDRMKKLVTGGT